MYLYIRLKTTCLYFQRRVPESSDGHGTSFTAIWTCGLHGIICRVRQQWFNCP